MKRRGAVAMVLIAALLVALVVALVLTRTSRGPAGTARPAPATSSHPAVRPAAPSPTPTPESAEAFASRVVVAYLSWRWDQPVEVIEDQVRPYVTEQLWQRLTTQPNSQWSNPGGRDLHEVDTVTVTGTQVMGRSVDGVTVELAVVLTMHTDKGTTAQPHWVQVHVVGRPGDWLADDIQT